MPLGFKLLVFAIAAVLLLAIFYTFIAPLFFPGTNTIAEIEKSLKNAETGLGEGFGKQLTFEAGAAVRGVSFDTRTRNVVFSCNSAALCCPKGEKCSDAIEWSERRVIFREAITVETTARCEEQAGLFACKIYFGETPAQVKIAGIEAEQQFDLSMGKPTVVVSVENTGSKEIFQGAVDVKVAQLSLRDGQWQETFIATAGKTENLGGLLPDERKEVAVELNINVDARFKVEVTASGLDAGHDSNTIYFNTSGAASSCAAEKCDSPQLSAGECTARCYCTGCMLGSDCLQMLREAGGTALGLAEEANLDAAENYILGSNIVEFVLPLHLC